MIRLELADLVVIAGHTLGLDTARTLDLLDPAAAERALAQVPDGEPDGLARPAAALLCALVRSEPLRHGNQQFALAAVLQFLALNGQEMEPDPPEMVAAMVADIAAGALSQAQVADRLASRLRPAGGLAARVEEEPMRPRPALSLAARIRKATVRKQPTGTFRRFTDQARRVVVLAQEEARMLNHSHVGTEHLLLGLVVDDEELAAKALESLGLSLAEVRHQVTEITGHGQHTLPGHIPFTPQAKKALEQSLREALSLGHNYIGAEHLLLGLFRVDRGIAARILTSLGAAHDRVRERIVDLRNQSEQAGRESRRARRAMLAELADTADQLGQVRAQKETASDAEDFEAASALRERERELLAEKTRLERQLEAASEPPVDILQVVLTENHRLHRELDRLRGVLRDHGIEPDDGTAQPA